LLKTKSGRETMSTSKLLTALLAVTFAAPLGFADSASAKKR
jgi:hypothetical protein